MRAYLKVKIKSLASEARIIRHEEHRIAYRKATPDELAARDGKAQGFAARNHNSEMLIVSAGKTTTRILATRSEKARSAWFGLNSHRRGIVREEARAAQLAYAFIRGKNYDKVEDIERTITPVDFDKVAQNVIKFGREDLELPHDKTAALKFAVDAVKTWVEAAYDEAAAADEAKDQKAAAEAAE